MEIATYYDEKLENIGMELLRKGEVKKVLEESNNKKLDYFSVGQWLLDHGNGDVIIFLQDILPYTAFNASYVNLFNFNNNLGNFLDRGGIVVWLGDSPFLYRVRCDKDADVNIIKSKFEEGLKFLFPQDFFKNKFNPIKVEDYGICFRDIISYLYIDEEYTHRYISQFTKYLGFLDLSKVCRLDKETDAEITFTGEILNYNSRKSLKPTKLSLKYTPLNICQVTTPLCAGLYSGSWIKKVGKGYFVRLFDYTPNIEELRDAIKIGEKIGITIGKKYD